MKSSYIPPPYIPLGQSDREEDIFPTFGDAPALDQSVGDVPAQWSSGICACCDDLPSCCFGLLCPCFLFGKNADYLGSGTFVGSCTTHFILWALINTFCCLVTDGIVLGCPGCLVACYACGYRKALRTKYNLQEAPCGDFITHLCCHLCALCQEYREIRERSADSNPNPNIVSVTAPQIQMMESASPN